MPEAHPGVLPKHSRPGISHYDLDLFTSIPLVTVDRAFCARGLVFTKPTPIKPRAYVAFQLLAFAAQASPMLIPAVDVEHRSDRDPLPRQSAIHEVHGCARFHCGCFKSRLQRDELEHVVL